MNSNQARRFLSRHGCTFEPTKSGHLIVRRGRLWTVLPMHGSRKEMPKRLWLSILKALELEQK